MMYNKSSNSTSTFIQKVKRQAKTPSLSKRVTKPKIIACALIFLIGYSLQTDQDVERRARQLLERKDKLRELVTIDKGGGACDIGNPTDNATMVADAGSTRTLLASYPGSGKRFLWTIIKAMTNYEVADDWNFSGKLKENPLNIKTSWPHKEGTWSWDEQMDQVMLMIRNPRRAIPSYHTMRWELGYAKNWGESYVHIPDTYMERPTLEQWETWRDGHFNREIDSWFDFYDFWMQAGFQEERNETHSRCRNMNIDCQPQELVDFENIYKDTPTTDFWKIGAVLDALNDVEVISQQARACVLFNIYNRTGNRDIAMHQGSRPFPDRPLEYKFTLSQNDRMFNRTIVLRDKYLTGDLSLKPKAGSLVDILNDYIDQNTAEYFEAVDEFLSEFVESKFGTSDCNTLGGTEATLCNYVGNKDNMAIFGDTFFPDDFPYNVWLTERVVLGRLYLNNGGDSWTSSNGWFGSGDHCDWEGITCSDTLDEYHVVSISLANNGLTGAFPTDFNNLESLERLEINDNEMTDLVPNDLCTESTSYGLSIIGDALNCPNDFDPLSGDYSVDCCDNVEIDVDIYLDLFVNHILGATDSNCDSLGGTESSVCDFMSNKANHDVFASGYPDDFQGNLWHWLAERATLVSMYMNNGGTGWTDNSGWLDESNHCSWYGVTCSNWNLVNSLILNANQLSGPFPTDLHNLSRLNSLDVKSNTMTGEIPNDLCSKSSFLLEGDAINCPNTFNTATGEYSEGCCDVVLIDVDIYLNYFTEMTLGSDDCNSLSGVNADICDFMSDKTNHNIFEGGYPGNDFDGDVWTFLKEREIVLRMYLNNGGTVWTHNSDWLGSDSHCDWYGVTCSTVSSIIELDLEYNALVGPFPDLTQLDKLRSLKIEGNSLTGSVPNEICSLSTSSYNLYLYGDSSNCPNDVDVNGDFMSGCCDEVLIEVDLYLQTFAEDVLGSSNCNSLVDAVEIGVCNYMSNKDNHDIFVGGQYPTDFTGSSVWEYLRERSVLVRTFLEDGGASGPWTIKTGWLGSTDHCNWYGVNCDGTMNIDALDLSNNQLAGNVPDFSALDDLVTLNLSRNDLTGAVPSGTCLYENLYITADNKNCPNYLVPASGEYSSGCCDEVVIDVDYYLTQFATYQFGDSDCDNLAGSEISVCTYMSDKDNHDIFLSGYPTDFAGDVWDWLKARKALVEKYYDEDGANWANNLDWLGSSNHCSWYGITCDASFVITNMSV